MIDSLLRGPMSAKLFALVQEIVQKTIDDTAGLAKPVVVLAVGGTRYVEMKKLVADKVIAAMPDTLKHVEQYAADALDVEATVVDRMKQLTGVQFEALIRPAFQQDEWILITVGAALGFLVGEMQVYLMLHMGH